MKKKLLITVGAGASIDFGLPSVAQIDQALDAYATTIYPLASDPTTNLYAYCRDQIQAYYAAAPNVGLRKWVNFEEVLYQLNLLAAYFSDPDHFFGSKALLNPISLPDVIEFGLTVKPVDGGVLRGLSNFLMDYLADYFVDACKLASTSKSAEIVDLRNFLTVLRKKFDIGIITLNYDNIFTQAISGLHTGFNSSGDFEPLSVLTRRSWLTCRKWNFIYHLHGSIHFAMTGTPDDVLHGISWNPSPEKDDLIHSKGRNAQDSMEGILYPTAVIVAGHGKTQQILRQPFRTYFAKLNQLVHEADSFLFLGYGFGDLHLNAAFSETRNRPRPTLIIDWAIDTQDPLPFRLDNWSYNLFRTLPGDAHKMSAPGKTAPADIGSLKADNEVEYSNDPKYPLAVWYNGLLEACKNVSVLLPYL